MDAAGWIQITWNGNLWLAQCCREEICFHRVETGVDWAGLCQD